MSKSQEEIMRLLQDPFDSEDIEWRVQQSSYTDKGPWVMVVPYITARAVQQRLDDVFGPMGWENILRETNNGFLCGIKAKMGDQEVTKWDGSEVSRVEPLKGAVSGAMKRAAVQFGIGRYLYNFEPEFVHGRWVQSRYECDHNFIAIYEKAQKGQKPKLKGNAEWATPALPGWALPSAKPGQYLDAVRNAKSMDELRNAHREAFKYASSRNDKNLLSELERSKEDRKETLAKTDARAIEESQQEASDWLDRMIADKVQEAENETVANLAQQEIIKKLAQKCVGKSINQTPLMKRLDYAVRSRIHTINNPREREV